MADFLNDIGSGIPILRLLPDWTSGIKAEYQLNQKIESFPGTSEQVVTFYDERPFSNEMPFLFFNKNDEYEFIEFFHNQKGRNKIFWTPSPFNLFNPVQSIMNGDNFLVIKDNKFRDSYRGFERLWVQQKSTGDWLVFKIVSVDPGPFAEQETLNLSVSFDRDIDISDIQFSSLFMLGRFDFDKITFQNINATVSKTNQRFVEIIKEYP